MEFRKLSPTTLRKHKGISFPGINTIFFCHDGNGHLFLARRSKNARDEHGTWDPGAGGLKHGQSLVENLKRELKEEYGVTPRKIDFIGYFDAFRKTSEGIPTHWVAMCFVVLVEPRKVKIMEPDILEDSGWFSLDALPTPMHSQFAKFMNIHGDRLKELMATQTGNKY